MATKNLGAVTAYAYAKAGGYTGTEEEFQTLMAALPDSVEDAQEAVSTVTGLTAQATKVASTAPARATYNKIANRIDFEIPEGNGIASVTLTSTSGAVKTYTITFDDGTTTTFNVTDGEVTQEAFEEAITELDEKKANYDGYYDEMTVGTAEQLISSATIEDDELYVFRSAGGTNDIGNRETDMLVGGTVAWNQMYITPQRTSSNGIVFERISDSVMQLSGTATSTAYRPLTDSPKTIVNHVYYVDKGADSTLYEIYNDNGGVVGGMNVRTIMGKATAEKTLYVRVPSGSAFESALSITPQIFDLTAMFGTEIADYIYGLEQANAGDGVAWFRKYFPKPYYAYNAGSLQSVNVASHDLTGFNQWDEEWELGTYGTATGAKNGSNSQIRCKNKIPILASTAYYTNSNDKSQWCMFFDSDGNVIPTPDVGIENVTRANNAVLLTNKRFISPSDASSMVFYMLEDYGTTYKGDICINRVWTGYRNGEYEEYVKHSYPYDESVELRGIPQLVDGELKYDGDTYESSGKVTRKYQEVNLGDLNYTTGTFGGNRVFYTTTDIGFKNSVDGIIVGKPYAIVDASPTAIGDKCIDVCSNYWDSKKRVVIRDSDFAEYSVAQVKEALDGVYLMSELYAPTTEQATPFTNPQIVDDFGTEEYVDAGVKNGTRDVAIPVGHVTNYMANLRDKLQHLPSLASSDGDYLVNQSGTSMSLKPIAPYFNAEHPNLTAGSANQLLSTITIEDQTPYHFRTSGGSVDIGDRETDMMVGGTIAWNQLVEKPADTASRTSDGITWQWSDGVCNVSGAYTGSSYQEVWSKSNAVTVQTGHVYLFTFYNNASTNVLKVVLGGGKVPYTEAGCPQQATIKKATADGAVNVYYRATSTSDFSMKINCLQVFDLTQMFGSTIADYIQSLETANAGAGIAYFRSMFPKPYYAYNAGELLSVSGLQSHDMVGFNAFTISEAVTGGYNRTVGQSLPHSPNYGATVSGTNPMTITVPSEWSSVCFITDKLVKGSQYEVSGNFTFTNAGNGKRCAYLIDDDYVVKTVISSTGANPSTNFSANFTPPEDGLRFAMYLSNGTSNSTITVKDLCVHLRWDGERDGEFEEYVKYSYPLDSNLILRGIPKLDASNNLYYDGDTYESDGTVTRRYGVVDLGSLTWTYKTTSTNPYFAASLPKDFKIVNANAGNPNVFISNGYVRTNGTTIANNANTDKAFVCGSWEDGANTRIIRVADHSYTDDATFKTAMSGVYLVYELATPTTESAEPYTNPQIVDDFGTEEYVTDSIVPVGHVTQYQPNLRAKLEMAPNSPDGDGDYIVRQTNGTNEYVELVIPNELPAMPTTDGSYTLGVTVSNGAATLSWVSNT